MHRRAILSLVAVAPIAALFAPAISATVASRPKAPWVVEDIRSIMADLMTEPGADLDAPLVAALRRARELEDIINGADDWDDDALKEMAAEFSDCHAFIAVTPCHGVQGVVAKLNVLKWLRDNGSTAEWEDDLVHTAIAALTSPEAGM